jgi:hypothetical protein
LVLYIDSRVEQIRFGAGILKAALDKRGIYVVERFFSDFVDLPENDDFIAAFYCGQRLPVEPSQPLEAEGFEIKTAGSGIFLWGADISGLMYGLMELAEDISIQGIEAVESKVRAPFLKKRGIKFNLPFEPFDMGSPMSENAATCLDTSFWAAYIDQLAKDRYNLLSLWSEHPFHMMVRIPKYPESCPYSEAELGKLQDLFKFIMKRSNERGITVFLITWNIRMNNKCSKRILKRGCGI